MHSELSQKPTPGPRPRLPTVIVDTGVCLVLFFRGRLVSLPYRLVGGFV